MKYLLIAINLLIPFTWFFAGYWCAECRRLKKITARLRQLHRIEPKEFVFIMRETEPAAALRN